MFEHQKSSVANDVVCCDNNACITEADLLRVQQLLELMFIGGLAFDKDDKLINGTRWDYETSIFVGIELLATVGMWRTLLDTGRYNIINFMPIGIINDECTRDGSYQSVCIRDDDDDDDAYVICEARTYTVSIK